MQCTFRCLLLLCAFLPLGFSCKVSLGNNGTVKTDNTDEAEDPVETDVENFLSSKYPGDLGMEEDPAVVWMEDFEQESLDDFSSRYDYVRNIVQMDFSRDVPTASIGSQSLGLSAGGNLVYGECDFYKGFGDTEYDEWYVRWYAKYQIERPYHHAGLWFGGYNPSRTSPAPGAGTRPAGNERFSVSVEPNTEEYMQIDGQWIFPLDFYNYWMKMKQEEDGDIYGNRLIHNSSTYYDEEEWVCIEVRYKLNTNMNSADGARLTLWIDDQLIIDFNDDRGYGYWSWEKFCPVNADLPNCTDFPPDEGEEMIPLDLQTRITETLTFNYIWPQNYNTNEDYSSTIWFDDIVVATKRIGSIQ